MKINRQRPIVVQEYIDTIGIGETEETEAMPVVGYSFLYGMIYSSKKITITIFQGCNDSGGVASYRYSQSYTVNAGECEAIETPIFGKFLKIKIDNDSGEIASIESFFCVRGIE